MARRRRALDRGSKTTKGWRKHAPKTKSQREALFARCGRRAFLQPDKLKFPIMRKTGPCVPDCEGIRAAKSRAGQYHHRGVKAKANRLGKTAACHWAR